MPPPWLHRAGAGWVLRYPPPSSGRGSAQRRRGGMAPPVQDRDLARAAEYAAGQRAVVLRVCAAGAQNSGHRRGPHRGPPRRLVAVLRPWEFAKPLPQPPQPKDSKNHPKPAQFQAPVTSKTGEDLGAPALVVSPAWILTTLPPGFEVFGGRLGTAAPTSTQIFLPIGPSGRRRRRCRDRDNPWTC